jgi:hypothetical protein
MDPRLKKRGGRFGVTETVGDCANRTFPGGAELWDYGPGEVEKYASGKPSRIPDPEPLV